MILIIRMTETTVIKGIHYETGRAVEIEVRDGLIHNISEQLGFKQAAEVFVAPGLIDNQINGYRGVDFSGLHLTTDEMRAAVECNTKGWGFHFSADCNYKHS